MVEPIINCPVHFRSLYIWHKHSMNTIWRESRTKWYIWILILIGTWGFYCVHRFMTLRRRRGLFPCRFLHCFRHCSDPGLYTLTGTLGFNKVNSRNKQIKFSIPYISGTLAVAPGKFQVGHWNLVVGSCVCARRGITFTEYAKNFWLVV